MLTAPTLTSINNEKQIYLSRTPINFNIQNNNKDASLQKVTVEVYIWRGFQASVPNSPSVVFANLKKISPNDTYIAIEIRNEIKAFIVSSNLNQNNPQWAYNPTAPSTTSGEGCYFHIVYKVDNEPDKQLGTFFATTGFRYDFEKKGGEYLKLIPSGTKRRYAKSIMYDTHAINLTTTVATSYSGTNAGAPMIIKQQVNPTKREVQTGVACLIAYINRFGVWDTFTPFGRVVETTDFKRDNNDLMFRNPLDFNSQIQHTTTSNVINNGRKFSINTGLIDEGNNYQIIELLASQKWYLVLFENDVYKNVQVGLTADNTTVTADNTAITADAITITVADLGRYSTFTQIPVKCNTNSFVKKTRLNNKSSISYELEFEQTNNLIANT